MSRNLIMNNNNNVALIDQITDVQQSMHNTRRTRQQSLSVINLD